MSQTSQVYASERTHREARGFAFLKLCLAVVITSAIRPARFVCLEFIMAFPFAFWRGGTGVGLPFNQVIILCWRCTV